jgi:hypothetical protein
MIIIEYLINIVTNWLQNIINIIFNLLLTTASDLQILLIKKSAYLQILLITAAYLQILLIKKSDIAPLIQYNLHFNRYVPLDIAKTQ